MSVFQSSTEQPSGRPPKRAHADHDVESYKRVSSKDFYVGSDADEGEVDPDHDSTIFHACSLQHRIVVAKLICRPWGLPHGPVLFAPGFISCLLSRTSP
jgi:hypothetical protein